MIGLNANRPGRFIWRDDDFRSRSVRRLMHVLELKIVKFSRDDVQLCIDHVDVGFVRNVDAIQKGIHGTSDGITEARAARGLHPHVVRSLLQMILRFRTPVDEPIEGLIGDIAGGRHGAQTGEHNTFRRSVGLGRTGIGAGQVGVNPSAVSFGNGPSFIGNSCRGSPVPGRPPLMRGSGDRASQRP